MPYADPEKQRSYFRERTARMKAEGTYKKPIPDPEKRKRRYWANREANLAKRREKDTQNVEHRRAQRNEWAKKNPEKIKAQKKRLRDRHGPEINAKLREYMKQKPKGSDLTYGQIHRRKYYREHRDELIAKQKEYAKNNRAKINARQLAWIKRNQERFKATQKRYVTSHIDQVRERCRSHYYANREQYHKYSAAWAKAHPEVIRQRSRNWYQRNREKSIASSMAYHRRNRDHVNQKAKEWRERSPKLKEWNELNKERLRAQHKERWARYATTFKEFQSVYGSRSPRRVAIYRKWDACGELCYICGFHVELDEIHVDHVFPVAKGGTNDIGNLMPAHRLCNIRKGDKLNFPITRRDLIASTAHIEAIPRNLTAQVRPEWESRKLRRTKA